MCAVKDDDERFRLEDERDGGGKGFGDTRHVVGALSRTWATASLPITRAATPTSALRNPRLARHCST